MITKRICFVLGAGASMDFGFPSGIQLWNRICEIVPNNLKTPPQSGEQTYFADTYGKKSERFVKELRESGTSSIDAFLAARENDYLDIGKDAIAAALIPFERTESLFSSALKLKGNWYDYLFEQMAAPIGEFKDNQVSFLTYNYDRSLEFYIERVLTRRYQATPKQIAEIFESIPIVHLHGKLANLRFEWEDLCFREFKPEISRETITLASASIKIIHEIAPNTEEFRQARQLLSKADEIVFLGFGYDETNLLRLGLDEIGEKNYYGTTFGMTNEESSTLVRAFSGCLTHENMQILPFLRETGIIARERLPIVPPRRPNIAEIMKEMRTGRV